MSNKFDGEHSYDGIDESDNKLPSWWLNIFYVTIIFSIGYMGYYHWGGPGVGLAENFEMQLAQEKLTASAQPPPQTGHSAEEFKAILSDEAIKKKGQALYTTKCAACHGPDGGGTIGPNLTDKFWIHGGKIEQIANTITNGVPAKGMVSWAPLMTKEEIQQVTVYVYSLKGTKPAVGKAPEGNAEE
ncbi:MAG: c-type cytochrome [Oligoflexia bacterium]|nr:c-type cytochrome [Oligoflexia bacterium]